jgi:hypothetical protein
MVMALFAAAAAAKAADGSAADAVTERALALCQEADVAADPDAALLDALRVAEDAVAGDAHSARAHLAVFCCIAKQVRRSGVGLQTFGRLRRMRQEIDRAFELAPAEAGILTARGAYLTELPRAFGGDPGEGERLLRRALLVDPGNVDARFYLGRIGTGGRVTEVSATRGKDDSPAPAVVAAREYESEG